MRINIFSQKNIFPSVSLSTFKLSAEKRRFEMVTVHTKSGVWRIDQDRPESKPIDVIMTSHYRASSTSHSFGLSDSGIFFMTTGNSKTFLENSNIQ